MTSASRQSHRRRHRFRRHARRSPAATTASEPTYQGWVEADLIFVSPDEAGRIETLSVREGDTVEHAVRRCSRSTPTCSRPTSRCRRRR